MKWNYGFFLLVSLFLLNILSAQANTKKESQLKHKQDKQRKQPLLGHWDEHHTGKIKTEHHNVKDVQKHAPLTVSHHEAKTQVDLGHNKKKLLGTGASKSDMKLQDIGSEDAIHHKIQSHKLHDNHDNHASHATANSHMRNSHDQNQHKVALSKTNNHHPTNGHLVNDRRDKKAPKKVIINKTKKNKRAKRLHKQYIF